MAIYHLSAKPIQRSKGRSAVASAAYRAGVCLSDERTGEIHDYTRKQGVEHSEIITPNGENMERALLWNAAEKAEIRKDGTPAREYEIALPEELSAEQRIELTRSFARTLAERQGCAVDVAIHAPGKEGDQRNHHAHLLCTTRRLGPDGLGGKCDVELADRDRAKKNLPGRKAELETMRQTWAELTNQALARAGHKARIDGRSLKAQGIARGPTVHLGPTATAMERRGQATERGGLNRVQGDDQAQARSELVVLESQQQGISAARSRARLWREEQARVAAEARRQAEIEHERQRQLEAEERERRRQEQARKLEAEKKAREEQRQREPRERGRGMGMSR